MAAATALAASPVAAQSVSNDPGYDFTEAVKKSDGDKATQLLQSHPRSFVDVKDGQGNTGLIIAISRSVTWQLTVVGMCIVPATSSPLSCHQ